MKHKLIGSAFVLILSLACNLVTPTETIVPVTEPAAPSATQALQSNPMDMNSPTPRAGTKSVFFAIHVETRDHSTQSASVAQDWQMLVDMVTAFEAHGHRLTLEFQPQWAEYALQNPNVMAQIRAWEAAGHEIALHHHGLDHTAWDGYTNEPGHTNDAKYRGTMEDAFALLSQLPANGVIYTAGMTNEDTDWPNGIIYATGGAGLGGSELVGFPESTVYNGVTVTQIPYIGFSLKPNQPQANLEEVEYVLQKMKAGQSLGLVTHPFNFVRDEQAFVKLFDLLAEYDIQIKTVKEILG